MQKINYIILKETNDIKSKIIEKKLNKYISNFGPYIIALLRNFHLHFFICDMKRNTKLNAKGCYFLTKKNKEWFINIYIDNHSFFDIKETLYHELGHFADDLIGCFENNVEFSLENCKNFCFSKTNKNFVDYNKIENDFFTQVTYVENDIVYYNDLKESFASCFSELATGHKKFYMERCKGSVYKALENYYKSA